LRGAIEGVDREGSFLAEAGRNGSQAVFGNGENYGDGFDLSNDGESHGSGRLHNVARID